MGIFWYLWDQKAAYISHQNYPKRKFDGIIWLYNQPISPFSLLEGHMTWLCQPPNYQKRKFDPIMWLYKQSIPILNFGKPYDLMMSAIKIPFFGNFKYFSGIFPDFRNYKSAYIIYQNYLKRKFDPIIWLHKQSISPFSLLESHMTCLCKPSMFPFWNPIS